MDSSVEMTLLKNSSSGQQFMNHQRLTSMARDDIVRRGLQLHSFEKSLRSKQNRLPQIKTIQQTTGGRQTKLPRKPHLTSVTHRNRNPLGQQSKHTVSRPKQNLHGDSELPELSGNPCKLYAKRSENGDTKVESQLDLEERAIENNSDEIKQIEKTETNINRPVSGPSLVQGTAFNFLEISKSPTTSLKDQFIRKWLQCDASHNPYLDEFDNVL